MPGPVIKAVRSIATIICAICFIISFNFFGHLTSMDFTSLFWPSGLAYLTGILTFTAINNDKPGVSVIIGSCLPVIIGSVILALFNFKNLLIGDTNYEKAFVYLLIIPSAIISIMILKLIRRSLVKYFGEPQTN